jgi:hypothetical protein
MASSASRQPHRSDERKEDRHSAAQHQLPHPAEARRQQPAIDFTNLYVRTVGALSPKKDGLQITNVAVVPQEQAPGDPPRLLIAMTGHKSKRNHESSGCTWIVNAFKDVDTPLWLSDADAAHHIPQSPLWDREREQLVVSRCGKISSYKSACFANHRIRSIDRHYCLREYTDASGLPTKSEQRSAASTPCHRLSKKLWGHISAIFLGDDGHSFLAVNTILPKEDTVEVCFINGPLESNPDVLTLYRGSADEGEWFTLLSGNRLLVQAGEPDEPWSSQLILEFTEMKERGDALTWADVDEARNHMLPVEFADGRGSNSQSILELSDGSLLIAEKDRLHSATLAVNNHVARITVHHSSGESTDGHGRIVDGLIDRCQFHDISQVCFIEQGAFLVVDDRSVIRLCYDRTYRHAAHADGMRPNATLTECVAKLNRQYASEIGEAPVRPAAASAPAPAATAAAASSSHTLVPAVQRGQRQRSRVTSRGPNYTPEPSPARPSQAAAAAANMDLPAAAASSSRRSSKRPRLASPPAVAATVKQESSSSASRRSAAAASRKRGGAVKREEESGDVEMRSAEDDDEEDGEDERKEAPPRRSGAGKQRAPKRTKSSPSQRSSSPPIDLTEADVDMTEAAAPSLSSNFPRAGAASAAVAPPVLPPITSSAAAGAVAASSSSSASEQSAPASAAPSHPVVPLTPDQRRILQLEMQLAMKEADAAAESKLKDAQIQYERERLEKQARIHAEFMKRMGL